MRLIDADAFIAEEKKLYCKDCDSYHGVRCRACSFNDIWGDLDDYADAPTINAVELPCKIGDTVWIARRYKCHKRPRKGVVSEMFFLDDMSLEIVVKSIGRGKWGVHVFGTCEEAQAAIDRGNKI